MDDFLGEIAADQSTGGTECRACQWIRTHENPEQWDAACLKPEFSHASIWRAMRKRGATFTATVVRNHRQGGHRQ